MGIRELKEAYGKGKKPREAINAAIRAELPGGVEAIEALSRIQSRHAAARGNSDPSADELRFALGLVHKITDAMAEAVAKKYDLKSTREQ